jgi:hypothetical protein
MPLSVVSRVPFEADAARVRGELKRPSANPRRRQPADLPASTRQDLEADASDAQEPVSTAGLSILAQALAAYSQN